MSSRIIEDIVFRKRQRLNHLLALTESPIERMILARLLMLIENSIDSLTSRDDALILSGYKYYIDIFDRSVKGIELLFDACIGHTIEIDDETGKPIEFISIPKRS